MHRANDLGSSQTTMVQGCRTLPPVTFVVCSNRPDLLSRYWRYNCDQFFASDRLMVIMDVERSASVETLAGEITARGGVVLINGENQGLAHCRNTAIRLCPTDHIVFLDDEVTVPRETILAVKQEFSRQAEIVGVRIKGPEQPLRLPWYLSKAQLHYLAIHTERTYATWGAFMGFDLRPVRRHELRFKDELGRRVGSLASGDDTTFIRELQALGIKEIFLPTAHVHHNVVHHRLRFAYIARRAYWQGRSEYRRSNVVGGIAKEWRRNWEHSDSASRLILAPLYTGTVLAGILREALYRAPSGFRR
jgi:glycosyltransferase involved in cell wall biosynthesis